jgi:hypothetical protein
MPIPTVYLDECVNRSTAHFLSERGAQIIRAQEVRMIAVSDEAQVRYAITNGWLLLTNNMQDFIHLHTRFRATNQSHSGIITVPFTAVPERLALRCAMMLDWINAEFPDPQNRLFRWTDLQQRMIGGYTLEGYSDAEIALALSRAP